ncbi:hypothetical protein HanIR_Chr13g0657581 [Helianthus annuus]|nr:hypothetical protein HanIR_Chr13g0657581 [Helianthus annuus]
MLKNSPLPILDVHRVLPNDISLPIVCSHISYRVTRGIVNPAKCVVLLQRKLLFCLNIYAWVSPLFISLQGPQVFFHICII